MRLSGMLGINDSSIPFICSAVSPTLPKIGVAIGPIYRDRHFLHRGEWDKSIGDAPVEEGSQDAVVILGCPGRGRARHAGITPAPTRFLVTVLDVLHEESERVGIALVVLLLLHKLQ